MAQLLGEVDPAAMQAAEAKDLAAKVDQGMADYKRRKEKLAADGAEPRRSRARFEGGGPAEAPAPKPAAAPALGPSLGMTRDEFTERFGDCFERKGDYEQGEKRGEAFALLPACAPGPLPRRWRARSSSCSRTRVAWRSCRSRRSACGRSTPASPTPATPSPPVPTPPAPPPQQVHFLPGAPHPEVPAQDAPPSLLNGEGDSLRGRLLMACVRRAPRHGLTRALGHAAGLTHPRFLARLAVRGFAKRYALDMTEAELPLRSYGSVRSSSRAGSRTASAR